MFIYVESVEQEIHLEQKNVADVVVKIYDQSAENDKLIFLKKFILILVD
jgi:hypothetical protein